MKFTRYITYMRCMCAFDVVVQSRNRGSRFRKAHTGLDPEDEGEEEEEVTVLNTFVCLGGVPGASLQSRAAMSTVIWPWLHQNESPVGLKPKTTFVDHKAHHPRFIVGSTGG